MEIKDFVLKKEKLEQDIRTAVFNLVAAFQMSTGFSPQNIQIQIEEVTRIGDEQRHFIVTSIQCDIPLS